MEFIMLGWMTIVICIGIYFIIGELEKIRNVLLNILKKMKPEDANKKA